VRRAFGGRNIALQQRWPIARIFGSALHVSGYDKVLVSCIQSIRSTSIGKLLRPSLEDVFIALMDM